MISTRCRRTTRWWSIIAAATLRSITARPWRWRTSTRTRPIRRGGTFDRDANGELNGRVTDRATAALNRVGKRPTFTAEQMQQRNRDGLAYISKQFVRYGLTSVHHEGGDLFALQQVRARGDLLHRVSYEASGKVLEAMIAGGISTGFGDEWIRLGATSEHTVDGSFSERTMALSTPYRGVRAALQRQHHGNAGRPQCLDRARASGGYSGQLPRQRGCRHRYGAYRGGARAAAVTARRHAPQNHPLHLD